MATLGMEVPDDTPAAARLRAAREGTTVEEVLHRFLRGYGGRGGDLRAAVEDVLRMAKESTCDGGGRKWTREEIHRRG